MERRKGSAWKGLYFWVAIALLTPGSSFPRSCRETKECLRKYNVRMYQGESKSSVLEYNLRKQISFSRCDLQTGEEEDISIGFPNNLHNLAHVRGVSLINQNFVVKNATKANEGLYRISWYNPGTCLAEVNLTVLDPPPSADITPTSDVNMYVRSIVSPFGSNGVYIGLGLLAIAGLSSSF